MSVDVIMEIGLNIINFIIDKIGIVDLLALIVSIIALIKSSNQYNSQLAFEVVSKINRGTAFDEETWHKYRAPISVSVKNNSDTEVKDVFVVVVEDKDKKYIYQKNSYPNQLRILMVYK